MSGVQTREVSNEDADIRIDRWFRRYFPEIKHGKLEKLLRTGQIRLDGCRVKASTRLEAGQMLRIPPLPDTITGKVEVRNTSISLTDTRWIQSLVLHSDDDLIVINKPPGLAVQGGTGVTNHIDKLLTALVPDGAERPKLVHRLDRDTSGVLLIARRASVAAKLGEVFRGRNAVKSYWALTDGVPSHREGTITRSLHKVAGKHGFEKVVADSEVGKSAVTDYRVIDIAGRKVCWLLLKPRTGRTHQLRVHCALINTPIIGDKKYGAANKMLDGTFNRDSLHLHAKSITFPHPAGGEFAVSAPLPPNMQATWDFFGFDTHVKGAE